MRRSEIGCPSHCPRDAPTSCGGEKERARRNAPAACVTPRGTAGQQVGHQCGLRSVSLHPRNTSATLVGHEWRVDFSVCGCSVGSESFDFRFRYVAKIFGLGWFETLRRRSTTPFPATPRRTAPVASHDCGLEALFSHVSVFRWKCRRKRPVQLQAWRGCCCFLASSGVSTRQR